MELSRIFCLCSKKMLLSAGADVHTVGNSGKTALMRAAESGHSQTVKV